MIDRSHIGRSFAPFEVVVDPFQLRLFAKATGETRQEYQDLVAAHQRGLRGLLAPPTFLFSIWLQDPVPLRIASELGLELGRVLHGEQKFTYSSQIYSGDTITVQERITDIYDKRGGQLEFVVSDVGAVNQHGETVGTAVCTTVYRN